jgi:predicted transcriptional regulator
MAPQRPPGKKPDSSEPENEREKVSLYLPSDLAQELRIAAVKQRRTISAVAEQCIRDGLAATANKDK